MTGQELVIKERKEHFSKHGITVEKDSDKNCTGQLKEGARKLMAKSKDLVDFPPEDWDKTLWAKMCNKSYKDRLVIAASLIIAEIDRLQYNTK